MRKIPGCQVISTIGATAVSIWNPPVDSHGGVMMLFIRGSIIGPPTMMSARPWSPCFHLSHLCLIIHDVMIQRTIKKSPRTRRAYSIFFSVSGDCTPINGTSITDRSWDHQRSPMTRIHEMICMRRIVPSFGLRATNWASLMRVGFIDEKFKIINVPVLYFCCQKYQKHLGELKLAINQFHPNICIHLAQTVNPLKTYFYFSCSQFLLLFILSDKVRLVPRAGLEPACLAARDFKSLVSTISPPGHRSSVRVSLFFQLE